MVILCLKQNDSDKECVILRPILCIPTYDLRVFHDICTVFNLSHLHGTMSVIVQ